MEKSDWDMFSPMESKFRAYDPNENFDEIVEAFKEVLSRFKTCDQIQIEVSAPPKDYDKVRKKDSPKSSGTSGKPTVIGFAG